MKTAVILSARKEKDCSIPYPLINIEGNFCLLDRTIQILRELNFSKILLIVGYKSELFEKYALNDIIIIKNPDYEFTSSMGSLAKAEKFIDEDFILIEGDTFYEKTVIEKLIETKHENCFTITEESGSGDEAYIETCKGFITKISKDKHQICNYEGELMGVAKISLKTYKLMLDKWKESNNPFLNYEYLFFDCTNILERPYLQFTNLIWGDVDCEEDLKKLQNYIYPKLKRKENPFDYGNIVQHLQTIFPDKDIESGLEVKQIGGLSNKNFKVKCCHEEYVLRIPGNGSEGMVERTNEEQNSLRASKLELNPDILYFNVKNGIKLTRYIKNAETLNGATIQRPEIIKNIARMLNILHESNVRLNNEFNVFHEIVHYETLLKQVNGVMYDGYESVREQVMGLEDYLDELGVVLKPCHNDLVAENFIKAENGRIYLIDWEYSGMNDPLWDIAALFIESDFTKENQEYFLTQYYNGNIPQNTKTKILVYTILMDYLWTLWTCIKEAKGDNFGSYGTDRYNRCIKLLRMLNN